MGSFPDDRLYSTQHLWLMPETGAIGITTFAADELGDIIYIELPEVGATLSMASSFGVIESTKAVSDLHAPASGTVLSVNEVLQDKPGLLNTDPFSSAWIAKIALLDPSEMNELLSADEYEESIAG